MFDVTLMLLMIRDGGSIWELECSAVHGLNYEGILINTVLSMHVSFKSSNIIVCGLELIMVVRC